ncbi:MAG: PilZ domain-containing protein [Desulfocapsa sp.]|nr:PilZ domain-containing protein [Desulfocapsa sp.]
MKVQKAFVKANDIASIRCPYCSFVKDVVVSKFRNSKHNIKTHCKCGKDFLISLDFRQHYRKPTQLDGTYTLFSSPSSNSDQARQHNRKSTQLNGTYTVVDSPTHGSGQVQINNISHGGLAFSVSGIHNLTVGLHAIIKFNLNDKKQTELTKKVVIKSVYENNIGCEFLDQSVIGKDLGFFLRP